MKKHVLSIGLNDKDSKRQELTVEQAMEIINAECAKYVDGVTIIPGCLGMYTHKDGTVVIEKTIRCEFYGGKASAIKEIAKVLCKALNQESIAYESSWIRSKFIGA